MYVYIYPHPYYAVCHGGSSRSSMQSIGSSSSSRRRMHVYTIFGNQLRSRDELRSREADGHCWAKGIIKLRDIGKRVNSTNPSPANQHVAQQLEKLPCCHPAQSGLQHLNIHSAAIAPAR